MSLNSARAKADSTRRDLVQIIESSKLSAVVVSLVLDDFKEVIENNEKARYYYGSDSTILTYGRLIKSTIELIHQDYPAFVKHSIAFTFDDYADYRKAEAAYTSLKHRDSLCSSMMGCVGHADDKKHTPLQMADLIAHEGRHKSMQMLIDSDKDRPAFKFLDQAKAFYHIGVIAKSGLLSQLGEYPEPPKDGSHNKFKWTLD